MQNKPIYRPKPQKLQSDRLAVYLTYDSSPVGVNTF